MFSQLLQQLFFMIPCGALGVPKHVYLAGRLNGIRNDALAKRGLASVCQRSLLLDKITYLESYAAEQERKYRSISLQLGEQKANSDALVCTNDTLQVERDQLLEDRDEVLTKLAKLTDALEDQKAQTVALEEALQAGRHASSDLKNESTTLTTKLEEFTRKYASLQTCYINLQFEVKALESTVEAASSSLALTAKARDLILQDHLALESRFLQQRDILDFTKGELDSKKSVLAATQERLAVARGKEEALGQANVELCRSLLLAESTIAALTADNAVLEAKANRVDASYSLVGMERDMLKEENERMVTELKTKDQDLHEKDNRLRDAKAKIVMLEDVVKTREDVIVSLNTQLEEECKAHHETRQEFFMAKRGVESYPRSEGVSVVCVGDSKNVALVRVSTTTLTPNAHCTDDAFVPFAYEKTPPKRSALCDVSHNMKSGDCEIAPTSAYIDVPTIINPIMLVEDVDYGMPHLEVRVPDFMASADASFLLPPVVSSTSMVSVALSVTSSLDDIPVEVFDAPEVHEPEPELAQVLEKRGFFSFWTK
ncbi:hypothetical protein K474DRAFT_1709466 [Panus rudis PR-1116 ss-1]|nr:hypothetical protein K474DRAFT_1709466 [Panus rudis PR-1116 ss-1]